MNDQLAYQRIFDANWNRATEGLRVVEDYVRLGLNDAQLSRQFKQLRHDLAQACQSILSTESRVGARNTRADVGTRISTASESIRPDSLSLIAANLERAQQAIRCLEEFAKVLGGSGTNLESLRYRLYDLQSATILRMQRTPRLEPARLCVLVDCRKSPAEFAEYCRGLLAAGADVLQLRDKSATDRQLLETCRVLVECCREANALSIINDRVDLAALSAADGVHLGQTEIRVGPAREILGAGKLIGVSTHDECQLSAAIDDGADYVGCGPTFPSKTKTFSAFPGIPYLSHVAQKCEVPAFAIGGIHLDNLDEVLATGIQRIAVSQAVHGADDPNAATAELKRRVKTATARAPKSFKKNH
jgi:thiamine-phosphate pyrophosphorylase